jgi:hypothetical protein
MKRSFFARTPRKNSSFISKDRVQKNARCTFFELYPLVHSPLAKVNVDEIIGPGLIRSYYPYGSSLIVATWARDNFWGDVIFAVRSTAKITSPQKLSLAQVATIEGYLYCFGLPEVEKTRIVRREQG